MGIRRYPGESAADAKKRVENTDKSDGTSLVLGSSAYRDWVDDNNNPNLNEAEKHHDRIHGEYVTKKRDAKDDEFHVEEEQEAAVHAVEMFEEHVADEFGRLSTTERNVSHQIRKSEEAKKIQRDAVRIAAQTEDKSDDKYAKRRLPKVLEDRTYDESETDYYPGSRVLDKYM